MGMELLSPIDEYYIQLSYYSLIAIFQKTGLFICYNIYNVCLLHDFVATPRLSALPSALYFVLSKLALWQPHFNSCSPCFP